VLAQPVAGLLQHLQHIPLGQALLDAAGDHLGGALAAGEQRLVGGQQRHPDPFQVVLDLSAVVGAAGDPLDRLADHPVEAPVGPGRLGQQVAQAAIARHRDGEAVMGDATPTLGQVLAAGLHVVEVRHDLGARRQGGAGVAELTRDRKGRVLLVDRRHPAQERQPPRQRQQRPNPGGGPGRAAGRPEVRCRRIIHRPASGWSPGVGCAAIRAPP
jgi:hypothetical protein